MQQKIFDEALKNGVLHQNFLSDFVRADELVPESKLGAFEKKFRDNKVTKAMREKAGQPVENLTRFALFIHGIEKTGSIKQASALVRKHLFNYNELTSADRVARVMVPFWNWMKNNIPLQIEKLAQNPRFYKQYLHLKEQSQEDTEGDIPQWAREASFGLGGNKMYNPSLPVNDLNGIFGNSPVDPLRTLLSSMNEIAKVPTEIVTNKSLFTGKPIDYEREYRGGFDPAAWAKYGLGQFGKVGKTAYDAADGEGNILEAILNLINPVGSPVTLK
jgi:hypothetical protein